jgi:S1-C subfamily serine protease
MICRAIRVGALAVAVLSWAHPAAAAEAFPSTLVPQLIAASVRLKVSDPTGNGYATGTIIARSGQEALVVTCGHVFRDSQGQGQILVDTFGGQPHRGLVGELIGYDESSDVGLVAVTVPGEFEPAPLAPLDHSVSVGAPTTSVGCDHGADPTARISRLNGANKFVGPPNLQVAGQPVQGRSGGGLFSADGYLIGICNAADPQDDEGLYSAAANVHAILKAHDVRLLYRSASTAPVATQAAAGARTRGAPPLPPRPSARPTSAHAADVGARSVAPDVR